MIGINSSSESTPHPPRHSSLYHPDLVATLSRREESMKELIRTYTMQEETATRDLLSPRCITPPQQILSENLDSPRSSLRSPFESPKTDKAIPRHNFNISDITGEVLALPLMELICNGITGSPRDLQLDAFCISEIRRGNQQSRIKSRIKTPTKIPRPCADFFPADSPPSVKRRTMASGIMRPLKYAMSTKSARYPRPLLASEPVHSAPSPRVSSPQHAVTEPTAAQPPPVNLQTLRTIFPSSDDWWRGVLYAHLTAYNFVQDSRTTHNEPVNIRGSKAQRTLGLSLEATHLDQAPSRVFSTSCDSIRGKSNESCSANESFKAIEDGLASCIDRIMSCMAGDYQRVRDHMVGRPAYVDYTLVRALAQVVRTCEMGADL